MNLQLLKQTFKVQRRSLLEVASRTTHGFKTALILALLGSGAVSSAPAQPPFYSPAQLNQAMGIQASNEPKLLATEGVQGVGIGEKDGQLAIVVLVDDASRGKDLPETLDSMAVDVRAVGIIQANQCAGNNSRLSYPLPVPLGVSGGNANLFSAGCCASGTIGFKVCDNTTGAPGWISNNHVVGMGTDGCPNTAAIGTVENQPGSIDNLCLAAQNIGTLNRLVPMVYGTSANNTVDAAFVQSTDAQISANILNLGPQVNTAVAAFVNQVVRKNGRTTDCTQGRVSAINMTINVNYSQTNSTCTNTCGVARFLNQIMYVPTPPFTSMSAGGDSGSPVVDTNLNAVALNFAGDTNGNGFGNPISAVLTALNVRLCSVACTITCPANISRATDAGVCSAVVNYPAPTATGFCGTVTCNPASGSAFAKGITTVNCSTTDGPSCSFTITVTDTEPPKLTCPASVTQCNDPGQCSAAVRYTVVATDNCGVASLVCNPQPGTVLPVGSSTVNCVATDTSSNSASCSFPVTIKDCEPPVVACVPGVNPSAKKIPAAGKNPKSGQNPDGFYQLLAKDNCDPNPKLFVQDSGSSFLAGPFANGDVVKITQSNKPNSQNAPDPIVAHLHLRGDALLYAADNVGNISDPVSCLVPPPPK